jgi:hypothetical protein
MALPTQELGPPANPGRFTGHFGSRFIGCEHPSDAGPGSVSLSLPSSDFALEPRWVVDAAVEALAAQPPISISTILSQLACLGV